MRKLVANKEAGFTLIELMIVVAILGILAATAIPQFTAYIARSKAVEATTNLDVMFKGASSYYQASHKTGGSGTGTTFASHCKVTPVAPGTIAPGVDKQKWPGGTSFDAIHFWIADYVYYDYALTGTAGCAGGPNENSVYTMSAIGNLDGDDVKSTFNLHVGSTPDNDLFHAAAIEKINETD